MKMLLDNAVVVSWVMEFLRSAAAAMTNYRRRPKRLHRRDREDSPRIPTIPPRERSGDVYIILIDYCYRSTAVMHSQMQKTVILDIKLRVS
jgi:hypothetical protein